MGIAEHVVAVEVASVDGLAVPTNGQAGLWLDGILCLQGADTQCQAQYKTFCNRFHFHSRILFSSNSIAKIPLLSSQSNPYNWLFLILCFINNSEENDVWIGCKFNLKSYKVKGRSVEYQFAYWNGVKSRPMGDKFLCGFLVLNRGNFRLDLKPQR
jgi:hypothetical protein